MRDSSRMLRFGGGAGLVFAGVWLICATAYLLQVGIPASQPTLASTISLMRRREHELLFWLWPVAFLALIPFGVAARDYVARYSPVAATVGTAFLLLNAAIWFVYHAAIMASFGLAKADPVNETQLSLILTFVGTLASPLFVAFALYAGAWALALAGRAGSDGIAGWCFAAGSVSSMVYFVMRYTGPYRPAEIVHELMILFMLAGVGILGVSMLRATSDPVTTEEETTTSRVPMGGAV